MRQFPLLSIAKVSLRDVEGECEAGASVDIGSLLAELHRVASDVSDLVHVRSELNFTVRAHDHKV